MQDGGWKRTLYVSPAYEEPGEDVPEPYENPLSWIDGSIPMIGSWSRCKWSNSSAACPRTRSSAWGGRMAHSAGFACHAFPIKDPEGEVSRVAGLAEDITESERAQEALRESEERFDGTFKNAAVGIAHVDAEGHFLLVNEKLCDIVGYTRDELLGEASRTSPTPKTGGQHDESMLMRGGLPSFSLEKRYFSRMDGCLGKCLAIDPEPQAGSAATALRSLKTSPSA